MSAVVHNTVVMYTNYFVFDFALQLGSVNRQALPLQSTIPGSTGKRRGIQGTGFMAKCSNRRVLGSRLSSPRPCAFPGIRLGMAKLPFLLSMFQICDSPMAHSRH
jgi:hypothetical protein